MPALETVLNDIRGRGIDLIYNLGDLIGKGPHSDIVVDVCREVCQVIIRGNWEDDIRDVNGSPAWKWYRQQIGEARIAYLSELPNVYDFWMSGKRIRLYHASQESVHTRIYAWESYEVHQAMFENTAFTGTDYPEPDVVGYGDIHCAYMMTPFRDQRILFNAGSVGNPLDTPQATYVILTGNPGSQKRDVFSIDFVRLPYDIERTIDQARAINLPDFEAYAIELRTGVYRGQQNANPD